jgi:hypothetical protein
MTKLVKYCLVGFLFELDIYVIIVSTYKLDGEQKEGTARWFKNIK